MTKRLIALGLALAVMALGGPASANSRGKTTISPTSGTFEGTYPSIPAQKPPGTFFTQVRPPGCSDGGANSQYCDTIQLEINVPEGYRELYYIGITLSYDVGATENRVDLYVWSDNGPVFGGPVVSDVGPHQPKRVKIGEPPTGLYYITVVNSGGINSGYKLKVEWALTDLGPDYKKNKDPVPTPRPSPKKSVAPPPPISSEASPVTLKTVKVPGPDGELIEVAIPLVKTKGVSSQNDDRGNAILPLVLGLLGAGLLSFLYFFVWRRRRAH